MVSEVEKLIQNFIKEVQQFTDIAVLTDSENSERRILLFEIKIP